MSVIFNNFVSQLIYFIGIIFIAGFLISILNRIFYTIVGGSRTVCYATGFLGTPIHELAHAVMCIVFLHRIEEIKLFQIDNQTGVLGYVNHSYNRKNIYQNMGNYFIGIAPIIAGGFVIFFAMQQLIPGVHSEFAAYVSDLAFLQADGFTVDWFAYATVVFKGMFLELFYGIGEGLVWWVFILIALCISLHMNLSGADIKGALPAIPLLMAVLFVINLILGFVFGGMYGAFTEAMSIAGAYLSGMLVIALVLSVLSVLLALIVRIAFGLLGKLIHR